MEARLTRRLRGLAMVLAAPTLLAAAPLGTSPQRQAFDQAIDQAKAVMLTSPAAAETAARRAQAIAASFPLADTRDRSQATALWLRGEATGRANDTRTALRLLDLARRKARPIAPRSKLYGDILLSEGGLLIETGQVTQALRAVQEAHELFAELKEDRSRAKALILLALLYDSARDRSAALRYFSQAINAYDMDLGLAIAILNGRGMTLTALGRYPQAERDFAGAQRAALKMGGAGSLPIILGNLANVYLLQQRLNAADATIARGLALSQRRDSAFAHSMFVRLAAQSALQHGNLPRARRLIEERFAGVDLSQTILTERDDHQTAYAIYTALNEPAAALAHLKALKRLDDQATEVARSNSAALAAARFDYANQELRIAKLKAGELQATVAHERDRARLERLIFVGAGVTGAVILLLLGIAMLTLRRSRDRLQVARDKLERALAAKTEFLAATSHEIRTPLNGILGMTEVMIADRTLEPTMRDRLSVVHGAGMTMRALVDDILDVAKIETGKMTIEATPFDLRRTVDEACRLWREQAEAKHLGFLLDIDSCPNWIVGDVTRVRQIVFNLLSNAVKFTSAGYVSVATTCSVDRLSIRVTDTGIGIAPDAHELIFDSFRQGEEGISRRFGGTGLGLSICRSLSRAMGGDVRVESALGEGATFTLHLPLIAAEAPIDFDAAPPMMLVVGNPITRAMLKALFEAEREVVVAADLPAAIDLARARPIDRVMVDADGTVLDGASGLSALVASAGPAPVALLTPPLAAEQRARVLSSGIAALIEKPIGKKTLVDRVLNLDVVLVRGAA
ncbi:ATP-binding protein [Sphingomonas sp.]|uniref:ATP-binding protein n=1 Tax=Sphingomonas sp. TaxID=28214 RepID=UPI0035C82669